VLVRTTMFRLSLFLFLVVPTFTRASSDVLSQLRAELTASGGKAGDEFGISVAVCGNTVVVGASELNSSTLGAAYVYVKGSQGWANMTQTAKLTASNGVAGAVFGSSVACYEHTVVVGAPHQHGGEAYVFVEPLTGWSDMTETARLTASDEGSVDDFGYSVAIDGKTIVVGAPQATGRFKWQGKSYIFEEPNGGWKTTSAFTATLTAPDAHFDSGFGACVSISGNTLVVGAPNEGPGAAYVFVEPADGWKTTSDSNAELTASDATNGAAFGYSLSVSGNGIAVGAYQVGEAYIFVEPLSGWSNSTETAKVTAPNEGSDFAYSLSLRNSILVIGSANDPSDSAVFVYTKPARGWETTSHYSERLTTSDGYGFGFSVAVGGGVIVAGSIGKNDLQGAAYVFAPE
jgi:hypothetical protein